MHIADSQVHIWPPDRPERPLIRDGRENSPYRYEQLVADMDGAGIDCAILVPPSIEGPRNDYALEAVQKYPGRFAVMGRFPLDAGSRDALAGWRKQPGMLGVRFVFHRSPLKELLEQLDPAVFWQIHRSTIVNVNAIDNVGRDVTGHVIVRLKGRAETLRVSQPFAYRFRQM